MLLGPDRAATGRGVENTEQHLAVFGAGIAESGPLAVSDRALIIQVFRHGMGSKGGETEPKRGKEEDGRFHGVADVVF